MTDEVKLRLLLELRKQEAADKLSLNQEEAERILGNREDANFRRPANDYWEGRLYQCAEVIDFLDGKIEVNVTTTVLYK